MPGTDSTAERIEQLDLGPDPYPTLPLIPPEALRDGDVLMMLGQGFSKHRSHKGKTASCRDDGAKPAKSGPVDDSDLPIAPLTWAQRLKRVFEFDITLCPHCGGSLRVIAGGRLRGAAYGCDGSRRHPQDPRPHPSTRPASIAPHPEALRDLMSRG